MSDNLFQDLNPIGSDKSAKPATVASTTSIAPNTFLSFITGTTAIATVVPPVTGHCVLCFVFTTTTPTAFTTAGNMKAITTPTSGLPMFLIYNPVEGKWYTK